MQELLARIIEMDAKARKARESAEREKVSSEQEIEELRQKIYNDYISRAKERVEKAIAVDRHDAQEKYAAYAADVERLKNEMRDSFTANGDRWVKEIVARVTGQ